MSFPPATEMFQFARFASRSLWIQLHDTCFLITCRPAEAARKIIGIGGFPHSEICGSKVAHTSPQLIAACHVLHRLYAPRHPRIALTSRLRVHTTNVSAGTALRPTNSAEQRCAAFGADDNLSQIARTPTRRPPPPPKRSQRRKADTSRHRS